MPESLIALLILMGILLFAQQRYDLKMEKERRQRAEEKLRKGDDH